jgi:hypothetical protein
MNASVPLPLAQDFGTMSVSRHASVQRPFPQVTSNVQPSVSVTTVAVPLESELLVQAARMKTRVVTSPGFVIRDMIFGPLDEVGDSRHEVVGIFQIA